MIYDIGVDRNGVALRRVTPETEHGVIAFIPEPSWIVTRWSGLTDSAGTRIYGHDVVELGGARDTKMYGAVLFQRGHFVVWRPDQSDGVGPLRLEKYCTPTFIHMIKVVGTVYDEVWQRSFQNFPIGELSKRKRA